MAEQRWMFLPQKHQTSPLVLTDRGEKPSGTGCLGSCLASPPSVCLWSNFAHLCDAGKSATEWPQTAAGGPQLAREAMVSGAAETTSGGAMAPPKETGPSRSAGGMHMASEAGSPSALGLAIGCRQMCINPKCICSVHFGRTCQSEQPDSGVTLCMRWYPDGLGVTLLPNPFFLPKRVPSSHVNQAVELAAFSPPSSSQQATELSEQLCPVRTLKAYVAATALLHKSNKLFVC